MRFAVNFLFAPPRARKSPVRPALRADQYVANLVVLLCTVILLSACATSTTKENWPRTVPARSIFVQTWEQQQAEGSNDSSLDNHLVWVRRFYEGSIIYPIGWNDMTESVLESLADGDRKQMETRLEQLGIAICVEWAKNNAVRRINSTAVAVWGNALRTAVENKEQVEFVGKIEADVAALLNNTLDLSQIRRERYYPPEDYDDF